MCVRDTSSRVKNGFTIVDVMFAATILVIVVGFANVTEKASEQIQFREQKTELASELENSYLSKLNARLITFNFKEYCDFDGKKC